MTTGWRPPIFDRLAMAIVSSMVALPVVAFLALDLSFTPLYIAVAAIVAVVPIAEVAILRRRMRDVWHSQRRYVPHFTGDLPGTIEVKLQEAGLGPTRVSISRTPMGPEREVLFIVGGLNVTVISAPRGHVIYLGPDRTHTRTDVERAKAAVDAALAGPGAQA